MCLVLQLHGHNLDSIQVQFTASGAHTYPYFNGRYFTVLQDKPWFAINGCFRNVSRMKAVLSDDPAFRFHSRPRCDKWIPILFKISQPSNTCPKTTCFPFSCDSWSASVMKNCEVLEFLPLFAIPSIPKVSNFNFKPVFSSLNLPPYIESPPDPSPAYPKAWWRKADRNCRILLQTCHRRAAVVKSELRFTDAGNRELAKQPFIVSRKSSADKLIPCFLSACNN